MHFFFPSTVFEFFNPLRYSKEMKNNINISIDSTVGTTENCLNRKENNQKDNNKSKENKRRQFYRYAVHQPPHSYTLSQIIRTMVIVQKRSCTIKVKILFLNLQKKI